MTLIALSLNIVLDRPIVIFSLAFPLVLFVLFALYRLNLHPLASVPGPKAAALSRWYETYFDVYKVGNFPFQIQHLHDRYGPIVRIGVNEVHILDPSFVPEILPRASRKRNRTEWTSRIFVSGSLSATEDHDLHLRKRKELVKLYSRHEVLQLEGMIDEHVAKLIDRIRNTSSWDGTSGIINLSRAFEALTRDVIYKHISANAPGDLDLPEFNFKLRESLVNVHFTQWTFRSFPFLEKVLGPLSMLRFKPFERYRRAKQDLIEIIMAPLGSFEQGIGRDLSAIQHPTILAHIQSLKRSKARELFWMHAASASIAGIETMPMVLTVLAFHILDEPTIHQRLRAEILSAKEASTKPIPLIRLEQLPYLTATIKEGLRLSFGISARLSRIASSENLIYTTGTKDYVLPRGTAVSTSPMLQHLSPDIFPDPYSFLPSRWLDDPSLDRHLLTFSKGARQCLGMHVAYAVLRKTLAELFSSFSPYYADDDSKVTRRLALWKTDRTDVDAKHDFFIPFARLDSEGVQVKVFNTDEMVV